MTRRLWHCRARFSRAYDWTNIDKIFFDGEETTKTWISEVGLRLEPSISIYFGVLDANMHGVVECPSSIDSCFRAGVVKVINVFFRL